MLEPNIYVQKELCYENTNITVKNVTQDYEINLRTTDTLGAILKKGWRAAVNL